MRFGGWLKAWVAVLALVSAAPAVAAAPELFSRRAQVVQLAQADVETTSAGPREPAEAEPVAVVPRAPRAPEPGGPPLWLRLGALLR